MQDRIALYKENGQTLSKTGAQRDIVADLCGEYLIQGRYDNAMKLRVYSSRLFTAVRNFVESMFTKLANRFGHGDAMTKQLRTTRDLYRRVMLDAEKAEKQGDGLRTEENTNSSIGRTTDNKPVVIIDDDILDGVPKSDWIKTVKQNIQKFSPAIPVKGRFVKVNAITRDEFTQSKYTKHQKMSNRTVYKDKFRAAGNLDEIVLASTRYVNEDLKHSRTDNIKEFARGEVLIKVGNNDYSAKVIIGFTSGNSMVLYDVIDFQPTNLKIKKVNTRAVQSQKVKNNGISVSTNTTVSQPTQNVNTIISEEDEDRAQEKHSFSREEDAIREIQSIGRKSVNDFTAEDIAKTEEFAQTYWKEMGAKSPFFRAWFGDWRAHDQSKVEAATHKGDSRGVVRNTDTGWDIQVSGKVFNETKVHNASYNRAAREYLPYINDIVKKAVLLDSFALGKTKSNHSLLMHSLYAVADIGNGPEVLKLYVEEMNNPNVESTDKRAYQLQNVEKYQSTAKSSQKTASSISAGTGIHTVSDLFAVVKQKDKNFSPKAVDSVLLNKDGTPRVFYHRTNADFTVFDTNKAGSNQGQTHGDGIYLSTSKTLFDYAGNNVMELYASIRHPFEMNMTQAEAEKVYEKYAAPFHEDKFGTYRQHAISALMSPMKVFDYLAEYASKNGMNVSDILKGLGYDGVHDGPEWVAFDNTQIKSATDNIGTFDGRNADIRYSLSAREQMDAMVEEYGAIPKGEHPKAEVEVPQKTSKNRKVRRFVRTVLESGHLNAEMVEDVNQAIVKEALSYVPTTNEQAVQRAKNTLSSYGTERAIGVFLSDMENKAPTEDGFALGEVLLYTAAKQADTQTVMELVATLAEAGTRTGRALQSMRMLKKMPGLGQLLYVQRVVDRLNQDIEAKNERVSEKKRVTPI